MKKTLIEEKKYNLRLHLDGSGYWLHLKSNKGKMATIFLGKAHGPFVESVLDEVYTSQEEKENDFC